MNSDYQSLKGTEETDQENKGSTGNRDENHMIDPYKHAPIGMVECSLEGKYISVNEEFCRITGYKREELLELDIHELIYPKHLARETDIYKQLISGSLPFYNIEQRYVRRSGAIIWVGIIRSLVRDDKGNPLYTIGVVQDITQRKAVQELLRKSEADLQQKTLSWKNFCSKEL
jgi:PAS domain S-box-containing protein